MTPVASAEMVTGLGSDGHWISGMNWYHRLERRYVEYGSSLEATRAFGVFRSLYDLVYNMNLAHLNPGTETLFEQLDDAGLRTACTPFLIYRGRHRHQVSLDGLLRRAVDATRLKFRHHTWGPGELFYGDLYASREVPCKSTSIPGNRDGYSACCAAELAKADGFDFLLFSLPDNDNYSHRHGPEASVESIAKADHCFGKLVEAGGGLDALPRRARGDPARRPRADGGAPRPAARRSARPRVVGAAALGVASGAGPARGQPDRARGARLPAAGRGRARRPAGGARGTGRDRGSRPGLPPRGGGWRAAVRARAWRRRRGDESAPWSNAVASGCASTPAGDSPTCAAAAGRSTASSGCWRRAIEDGRLRSEAYPDPLARVWAALSGPHAGDFVLSLQPGFEAVDWGGVSHAGGGSHGSLHAGDSLGPLLFVGCGPAAASEQEQWTLSDVAPAVLRHFGL